MNEVISLKLWQLVVILAGVVWFYRLWIRMKFLSGEKWKWWW